MPEVPVKLVDPASQPAHRSGVDRAAAGPRLSSRVRRDSRRKTLGVLSLGGALMLLLSGCFVVPLLDGRSPFDDPSGSSFKDIGQAIPVVQEALDQVDDRDGEWSYTAGKGVDRSCEGACNLHVAVRIAPKNAQKYALEDCGDCGRDRASSDSGTGSDTSRAKSSPAREIKSIDIPAEVLEDVLLAAVPAAESAGVNVRILDGEFDDDAQAFEITVVSSLDHAIEELFGPIPQRGLDREAFEITDVIFDGFAVHARTRTHSGVLDAMGLSR